MELFTPMLAQQSSGSSVVGGIGMIVFLLFYLAVIVIIIAGLWKIFTKAGHAGWLAIIPIVNLYFICKIAGRPGWWIILLLIPIVSLIITIIVYYDLAKSFGRGLWTTLGLIFLSPIFIPILGFGSAEYQGPSAG